MVAFSSIGGVLMGLIDLQAFVLVVYLLSGVAFVYALCLFLAMFK